MPDDRQKAKDKRRQQQARPASTHQSVQPERITYGRGEPRGHNVVTHGKGHDRHDR
jgi:hypothetical protein